MPRISWQTGGCLPLAQRNKSLARDDKTSRSNLSYGFSPCAVLAGFRAAASGARAATVNAAHDQRAQRVE
jgi:hypothetical protein